MTNFFSPGFLGRYVIEKEMRAFARKYDSKGMTILDIGCGNKPYEKYFRQSKYVGVDISKNADVVAPAWKIPLKNGYADLIILNQSLEHIEKTKETVLEMKRLLKKKGKAIISVPLTMRVHASPIDSRKVELKNFDKKKNRYWNVDYWRFTKFGLIVLFKDFKILRIKESNGYFTTLLQLATYFFKSLGIPLIFYPIYWLNNLLAVIIEIFFQVISLLPLLSVKKFFDLVYYSLPLNYIIVIQKE